MTCVFVRLGSNTTHISIARLDELIRDRRDVRLLRSGRPLEIELLANLPENCTLTLHPLVTGGKGGFGSLLRAFGKQILISSNKEACRDLNGRRMRDVNNEKKLKEWLLKQADNRSKQEDKLERLKRKRKGSPKHYFEDRKYQRQKQMIENELQNALDDAFNVLQRRVCQSKPARLIGIPEVESEEESEDKEEEEMICISQELYDKLRGCDVLRISKVICEEKHLFYSLSVADEKLTSHHIREDGDISLCDKGEETSREDRLDGEPSVENRDGSLEEARDSSLLNGQEMTPVCDRTELIDLASLTSARELLDLGAERLKKELQQRGLKCGGTALERANRLWTVRNLQEYPRKLLAKARGR